MIQQLKLFYRSNQFPFIVIVVLGLIAWLNPSTFLWRDDWLFLSFFYKGNYQLFNGHLAFEIKPLFQYILFAEFQLAGVHFAFYQLVNVVVLILTSFCFFSTLKAFGIQRNVALFCSLLLLLHPVNFVNAFWIFQQCELFHILFLQLSILYFKKYLDDNRNASFFIFVFFLFVQNYFFPNGIFFPVLFFLAYFLLKQKDSINTKLIFALALVFAVHLSHAYYIQTKMLSSEGITQNILSKLHYSITLQATSLYRIVIPNMARQSSFVLNLVPVVVFTILSVLTFKATSDNNKRNLILLGALGLIFSSVALVLTRYNQFEIHYYYSELSFPFYFLIIAVVVDHYRIFKHRLVKGLGFLVLSVFLISDFIGKNIFAVRNNNNQQQMELGASSNNRYVPFDDPCFLIENYFGVDTYSESESAVILYRSLLPQSKSLEKKKD